MTATAEKPAETAVIRQDAPQSPALKSPINFGDGGVKLTSLEDAYRFATAVAKSGLAPKGIDTPEAVLIALQHAAELGMPPMAGLQNFAIINGRPGIYGDAALALVRRSGLLESYSQKYEGEGDKRRAVVTFKRVGESEMVSTFSVEDAKKANLWGKQGPWTNYPDRMLLFRARGFGLRDGFGDVLKGLHTAEELQDTPPEPRNVTKSGLADAVDGAAETVPAEVVTEGGAK